MQISAVEAIPIRRSLDERFANAQKWIDTREYCLVRIEAADGTEGWGECWGPIAGNRELIESVIGPEIAGREVSEPERVTEDLRGTLRGQYHSFVPTSAISGVDIALWDCFGKQLGQSVSTLLGGRRRDSVEAYATGHFWPDVDSFAAIEDAVVAEAQSHVAAGFDMLKQKIGLYAHPDFPYGWREDVELVRSVRAAIGDDVALAVDANHAYDRPTAGRVATALGESDVTFFEEPVAPDHIDEYVRLAKASPVALAGGECWAFQEGFDRVIHEGGIAYAQPDVTSAGGFTGSRAVASLASAHNVRTWPHVFGSAVAIAASLQFVATLPDPVRLEYDRTPNPLRHDLPSRPIERDGATISIPDRAGIGISIDEDALADLRID